jgi:hypothetical protein
VIGFVPAALAMPAQDLCADVSPALPPLVAVQSLDGVDPVQQEAQPNTGSLAERLETP